VTKEELDRRWLQFKRFGEDRVLQIHAAERAGNCLSSEPHCEVGWRLVARFNEELGPYWDKRKTQDHCQKEAAAFLAFVRPIAAEVYAKALAEGQKSGLALHASDLAVIRADYKLNFGPGSPIAGSKVLSQVYAKGGQDLAAGREYDEPAELQEDTNGEPE